MKDKDIYIYIYMYEGNMKLNDVLQNGYICVRELYVCLKDTLISI